MKKRGFTLIILIVVIAIIGVLAAILVPAMLEYIKKANWQHDVANAKVIHEEVMSCLLFEEKAADSFYDYTNSIYKMKITN